MLNRVAIDRQADHVDALLDFVPDPEGHSPDMLGVTATGDALVVRLRLRADELEVLAVAFDNAVTGADGELYFRPKQAG
jgi:hypothetical protein